MQHARTHAETRTRERRHRLAVEAARLMAESGIRDFRQAKRKAAQRLGIHDDLSLPRNSEIEDALRTHQRLFQGDDQPGLLRHRREAAARAMRFFAGFSPRLVGAVLDGTADGNSAVCLQLFSDDPDEIPRFLAEHGIPAESRSRRLRLDRQRVADAPVWLFAAEDLPFDLTVLPRDLLRQAPLDRIDERPMRRASLSALERLLADEDIAEYERRA
ncbi:hypothetical protein [Coralloluteibacterium stylophorae]|uniref:Uncharacterized protein n=1 Tax=Coralloluteibacterium stylophorae TaxID=1776034 RepID=A0AAP2CCQ7_9GAMM|nr:hypothetical protein [Coralloluteibacterium stylophorae]MBS7458398.1 hypothetical protein [Coralloluteibacterium stylophorae]